METTAKAAEITMEREENTCLITMGDKKIVTTWARKESQLKNWLTDVQKIYGKKHNKNPLIVALSAERSTNFANGRTWVRETFKNNPYDQLQLCVGNHCLLWQMEENPKKYSDRPITIFEQPKVLKDFLYDSRTTIVGVGINALVGKLETDTDLMIPNPVELKDLAEAKLRAIKGEFRKLKVESLAKVVLGEEQVMEVARPTTWAYRRYYCLTDDLVKYVSIGVFLTAQMGSKLLNN